MGAVAERLADKVIVTNDNPRREAPASIAQDIIAGMQEPQKVQLILSRRAAIDYALSQLEPGDVMLIAGKGHEQVQHLAEGTIAFNDYAVAAELFAHLMA